VAAAKGLRLIEEAATMAAIPTPDRVDAVYNREQRYDDALKLLALLRERTRGTV
jgi:hypothetical protein